MPKMPTASVRLYVLLARKSSLGVIFRRGPSKQVLALLWDTATDLVRPGQWLKGRVYERRCDLSPSGEKLIYFAANHRPPFGTWTAVSRPPYWTALTLWPKGDAWGGGGLFKNERSIQLNHGAGEMTPAPDMRLPRKITVEPLGANPGWGEDDPILSMRMIRDGWVLRDAGAAQHHSFGAKISWTYPKNQVWSKTRGGWSIELRLLGVHERDGPWYVIEHRLLNGDGRVVVDFGRSDWADWSRGGDVLLARDGRLYRLDPREAGNLREIADLRAPRFQNVEAPASAKQWSGKVSPGT